jgi:hypothetical protein
VIPIPLGQKAPVLRNWQALRVTTDTLEDYFNGESQNVGLLLGEPSGGLVDIDLDTDEAVAAAPYFLPESFIYGRANRPASHYLLEVPGATTRKWQHAGKMLVELRSTGCQSLIPPSIHPDGDIYRRDVHSKSVATMGIDDLLVALNRIAAATLIARHWPETGRHDLALTLAGALLNAGWQADDVKTFVEACAVAGNDEELADRLRAVKDTVKRRDKGKTLTGWPRLGELLAPELVDTAREWLGIEDFPKLITPQKAELPSLVTQCAADIERRSLEPLWDGVLWIGKPTLLVGDPGKGKSLVTLDIAARVTTGEPWPCSNDTREPGTVMLLSAEDDADDTIVPRLEAAGADLSKVHIIYGVRGEQGIDWLALDKHWRELTEGMRLFKPSLLVIDPLSSFMGGADTNHEGESRKVLAGLAELAKQSRTAVLAIRHFRKGTAASAQGRVIGSVAFTAAARAVYGITTDPEDEDFRLLLCLKCNLAADTFGYRFHVSETPIGDPFVVWDSEHEYRSAEELLGSGSATGRNTNCKECGREFEARRRDAMYCSQACKQAAYRKSRNDESRKATGIDTEQDRRVTDTSVSGTVTSNTTRKHDNTTTSKPHLKSSNNQSQSVTGTSDSDGSLPDVTPNKRRDKDAPVTCYRTSHTGNGNNHPQQSLTLAESKYSQPCLNCGGKGCRFCDEQLRRKHYENDGSAG